MANAPHIPNRLIFIWFGSRFPFANVVAVRSAMRTCKPDETLLIHEGLSEDTPGVRDLMEEPGFRLEEAGSRWFENLPPGGELAHALYEELGAPATRANLLRLAALWKVGGIYLDTDTITIKDMAPLRRSRGFCGVEVLGMPASLFDSRNPARWGAAGLRLATRAALSVAPMGDRAFRRIEGFYPRAVNNAVVGSCPENRVIARAFSTIIEMDAATRRRRFRLGTHLMQRVTGNRSSADMEVLPPEYFYPLGPEISLQWFSPGSAQRIPQMIHENTHVVHWYSSLESRLQSGPLTAEYVEKNQDETAFARLAADYLE
jgi:hypothetical protein